MILLGTRWTRAERIRAGADYMFAAPGGVVITAETAAHLHAAGTVRPVPEEDPDPPIEHGEAIGLARRVSKRFGLSDEGRYKWASKLLERPICTFDQLGRKEADLLFRLSSDQNRRAA